MTPKRRTPMDIELFLMSRAMPASIEQVAMARMFEQFDVVCEAVPGSGKTQALVNIACWLMHCKKVPKDRILIVSYNKECAVSIESRLKANKVYLADWEHISRTWHAVGHIACKKMGRAKVVPTKEFVIAAVDELGLEMRWCDAQHIISYAKNTGCFVYEDGVHIEPRSVEALAYEPEKLEELLKAYERAKGRLIDHDDQILLPYVSSIMGGEPFRGTPMEKIEWVLVDELQDANAVQLRMLKSLVKMNDARICGIGDKNQSIYAWRGADPRSMNRFSKIFQCAPIQLGTSFRNAVEIVGVANAIAKHNTGVENTITASRTDKGTTVLCECSGPYDELEMLANMLPRLIDNYGAGNIQILGRTNAALTATARMLLRRGISVHCDSGNFRPECILFLNCLGAACYSKKADMKRIFEHVPGIGKKRLLSLKLGSDIDSINVVRDLGSNKITQRAAGFIAKIRSVAHTYSDAAWKQDAARFAKMIDGCGRAVYELTKIYQPVDAVNVRAELGDAMELANSMARMIGPEKTIAELYELYDDTAVVFHDKGTEANVVAMSTVHRAKGTERKVVVVIDGANFPCTSCDLSPCSLEQETNLLFVAVTRARDILVVSRYPKRRTDDLPPLGTLCDAAPWTEKLEWNKTEDVIEFVDRVFPSQRRQRMRIIDEVEKAKAQIGDVDQISWPFPLSASPTVGEETQFRIELEVALKKRTPLEFYLHVPKSEMPDDPIAASYLETRDGLSNAYETEMDQRINPPDDRYERHQHWLIAASVNMAREYGAGWKSAAWPKGFYQRTARAQYDIITPLRHDGTSNTTNAVLCSSVIAETVGKTHTVFASLRFHSCLARAYYNPDAEQLWKLCFLDIKPLWIFPWTIWRGGDCARSVKKHTGHLMAMGELVLPEVKNEFVYPAIEAAKRIHAQLASDQSVFCAGRFDWHLWCHDKPDCIWPFHKFDTPLIKENQRFRMNERDSSDWKKTKVFFDAFSLAQSPYRASINMEEHTKRISEIAKHAPPDAIEYLVAKDLGVPASRVVSEHSGKQLTISVYSEQTRVKSDGIEEYLSRMLDRPVAIKGCP